MPLQNEHAARQKPVSGFVRIRRKNNAFGAGIHVIYGVMPGGSSPIQSIHFDKEKLTSAQARKWLKDHGHKTSNFEEAVSKIFDAPKNRIEKDVSIVQKSEEKRLIYGVVLEPDTEDLQEDIASAEEIEKALHDFMESSRVVGLQHMTKTDSILVENYIAPIDFSMGDDLIKKGSWVQVTKIKNDVIWAGIKAGKITAYSIGGTGVRT